MKLHRDRMHVEPCDRDRLRRAGLDSVDAVLRCLGDQVAAWSRSSETVRVDLPADAGGGSLFIKRYHHLRVRARVRAMFRGTFFGRSRARAEFVELVRLCSLGARVVRPVAYGERRVLRFVRSAFVITEAVPDAVTLATFAQAHTNGAARSLPPPARRRFFESLGRQVGTLHRNRITHGAMFWRNVLVQQPDADRFEFVFLDAGPHRRRVTDGTMDATTRGIVRDLAGLAAPAADFCTRADMLRFFRAYLGVSRLDPAQRRLVRSVLREAAALRAHELHRLKMNRIFHYHLVPVTPKT